MKEAIQKAIEGGYRTAEHTKALNHTHSFGREFVVNMYYAYVTNDPLFWQCLGKALGWIHGYDLEPAKHNGSNYVVWLSHWHRFIDHIASEGDVDDFFTNLINNK